MFSKLKIFHVHKKFMAVAKMNAIINTNLDYTNMIFNMTHVYSSAN